MNDEWDGTKSATFTLRQNRCCDVIDLQSRGAEVPGHSRWLLINTGHSVYHLLKYTDKTDYMKKGGRDLEKLMMLQNPISANFNKTLSFLPFVLMLMYNVMNS